MGFLVGFVLGWKGIRYPTGCDGRKGGKLRTAGILPRPPDGSKTLAWQCCTVMLWCVLGWASRDRALWWGDARRVEGYRLAGCVLIRNAKTSYLRVGVRACAPRGLRQHPRPHSPSLANDPAIGEDNPYLHPSPRFSSGARPLARRRRESCPRGR